MAKRAAGNIMDPKKTVNFVEHQLNLHVEIQEMTTHNMLGKTRLSQVNKKNRKLRTNMLVCSLSTETEK